uniref:Uncharacterized protein n=1 Tax=Ananas comosus var. bracteatus TaxID=296719 RepID=A0A6V7QQR3_ANACO
MAGVAATAAYCQYWNGSPFMLGGRSAPRANAVITMQSTEKRKEAAIRRNPHIPKLTAAAAAAEDKRLMSEKNSPSPKGTITVSSNIYTLLPLRESPGFRLMNISVTGLEYSTRCLHINTKRRDSAMKNGGYICYRSNCYS